MIYAWRENQKKRPQHILDVDGRTLCQIENIKRRKKFRPFTRQSETPSPNLPVCRNCQSIAAQNDAREPSLSVLMGERIA